MKEYLFWIVVALAIIVAMIFIEGCNQPERITKEQWLERYKPETIEQAEAMAFLSSAKIKAESEARTLTIMNKFKIACAIGFVGSIIALGIGLWLRMKLAVGLGVVGAMGCLAGYGLACADIVYGKYVAIGGLIFGVIIGGATIFVLVKALIEMVKGGMRLKTDGDQGSYKVFKAAQKEEQSKPTEKIVRDIKAKL